MQGAYPYPSRGFGVGLPVTRPAWDSNLGPPASEVGSLATEISVKLLLRRQIESVPVADSSESASTLVDWASLSRQEAGAGQPSIRARGGAPRNPAPRNHFWGGLPDHEQIICKETASQSHAGCACETDRRVSTPLRSASPFSEPCKLALPSS